MDLRLLEIIDVGSPGITVEWERDEAKGGIL
jgi:hypothetical protein